MYQFTCLNSFHSDETLSEYVEGLTYTVKDGNTKLHDLVQKKWLPAGKVRLGGVVTAPDETRAKISGKGAVKNREE